MTRALCTLLIAALGALPACRPERVETPPAEEIRLRQEATRDACIARHLLARAEENLEALEEFEGLERGSPAAAEQGVRGPGRAAYEYARIYHHHAELRHAIFAHVDSALNHARTGADSLRHVQAAAAYRTPPPEPGTVDANVADAYARDRAALREDEDHRCNWDL